MAHWLKIAFGTLVFALCATPLAIAQDKPLPDKPLPAEATWNTAHQKPPLTMAETRQFMKRLAQFVLDNHMKRAERSPQRGMIYEYLDVRRKGQSDQFVQGEALDTMHDGAWFAVSMAAAYHATGDNFYKELLTEWQLPFYCKMLNQSDQLFSVGRNDARPTAQPWDREHGLQEGEKGFVPYFWDDGGSVSLERRLDKNPQAIRPSLDNLVGKPNPQFLLDGYSQGSSNHLAQDLGAMLETSYLLLYRSPIEDDKRLATEVALAAKNLHECRLRHHGPIPMCVAPAAFAMANAELMKNVPNGSDPRLFTPSNHYTQAFIDFRPGQRYSSPGFADNEQYRYYAALGHNLLVKKDGTPPKPLAYSLIYDAYTERLFFDRYYDDARRSAGINRFDLYPLYAIDGQLEHLRSQRRGPSNRPVPAGSRLGPQNMVVCGWALQLLRKYPDILTEGMPEQPLPADVEATLTRELSGGLRTWEAIFDAYGYIPTSLHRGEPWDHFSDSGGYAHLINAAAQWILLQQGKADWEPSL